MMQIKTLSAYFPRDSIATLLKFETVGSLRQILRARRTQSSRTAVQLSGTVAILIKNSICCRGEGIEGQRCRQQHLLLEDEIKHKDFSRQSRLTCLELTLKTLSIGIGTS